MKPNTPTIHLYTPAQANLVIQQGVSVTVSLCRWLPGGTTPYVWQLGDLARLQIRDAPISQGGVILAEASTNLAPPNLIFDPTDHFIKWRLEKQESADWMWTSGYYDLDVTIGSDEMTLLTGTIELRRQVTD